MLSQRDPGDSAGKAPPAPGPDPGSKSSEAATSVSAEGASGSTTAAEQIAPADVSRSSLPSDLEPQMVAYLRLLMSTFSCSNGTGPLIPPPTAPVAASVDSTDTAIQQRETESQGNSSTLATGTPASSAATQSPGKRERRQRATGSATSTTARSKSTPEGKRRRPRAKKAAANEPAALPRRRGRPKKGSLPAPLDANEPVEQNPLMKTLPENGHGLNGEGCCHSNKP